MDYWKKLLIAAGVALAIGFAASYHTTKWMQRQYMKKIENLTKNGLTAIKSLTEPDKIDLEIIIKEKNPYLKEV